MASPTNSSNSLRVVEFYSGVGGMHYALSLSRVHAQVVAAVDINDIANKIYRFNFPEVNLLQRNIQSVSLKEFGELDADMFLMSPPCQPFTRVGLKGDKDDPRTISLLYLLDTLPKLTKKPGYILVENVKGFESSETRNQLADVLQKCNYNFKEFLLSPTHVGIPNQRLRYFLLAKLHPFQFKETGLTKEECLILEHEIVSDNPYEDQANKYSNVGRSGGQHGDGVGMSDHESCSRTSHGSGDPGNESKQSEAVSRNIQLAAKLPLEGVQCHDNSTFNSEHDGNGIGFKDDETWPRTNNSMDGGIASNQPELVPRAVPRAASSTTDISIEANQCSSTSTSDQTCRDSVACVNQPQIGLTANTSFLSEASQEQETQATEQDQTEGLARGSTSGKCVFKSKKVTIVECNGTDDKLEDTTVSLRNIRNFLETLTEAEVDDFLVPEKLLVRFGRVMDIVTDSGDKTCCFTKAYGHYVEGTGSFLHTNKSVALDWAFKVGLVDAESLSRLRKLRLRYFTPREVANFHCFPGEFGFPLDVSHKQQYRVLGNSLNAYVVSLLLNYLIQ